MTARTLQVSCFTVDFGTHVLLQGSDALNAVSLRLCAAAPSNLPIHQWEGTAYHHEQRGEVLVGSAVVPNKNSIRPTSFTFSSTRRASAVPIAGCVSIQPWYHGSREIPVQAQPNTVPRHHPSLGTRCPPQTVPRTRQGLMQPRPWSMRTTASVQMLSDCALRQARQQNLWREGAT